MSQNKEIKGNIFVGLALVVVIIGGIILWITWPFNMVDYSYFSFIATSITIVVVLIVLIILAVKNRNKDNYYDGYKY